MPGRAALLLGILAIAGCGGGTPTTMRYTGSAPSCGRSDGGGDTATLTWLGGGFALAPYDGSLVVSGKVSPDGTLAGTLMLHPAQAPAGSGEKPGSRPTQTLSVTGQISPETARLTYAAPGCSDGLTLTRVHPPLL